MKNLSYKKLIQIIINWSILCKNEKVSHIFKVRWQSLNTASKIKCMVMHWSTFLLYRDCCIAKNSYGKTNRASAISRLNFIVWSRVIGFCGYLWASTVTFPQKEERANWKRSIFISWLFDKKKDWSVLARSNIFPETEERFQRILHVLSSVMRRNRNAAEQKPEIKRTCNRKMYLRVFYVANN